MTTGYVFLQLVVGIFCNSMSLISDSSQGVVDIITYAVSIYAQSHIDTTSDVRSMTRVGMYSASFGAISLITMCLVLSCIVGARPPTGWHTSFPHHVASWSSVNPSQHPRCCCPTLRARG